MVAIYCERWVIVDIWSVKACFVDATLTYVSLDWLK